MMVTVAVLGPIIMSLESDVSTVILNVSFSSTIMSSITVMSRHTELPTAVVEGIVNASFVREIKSLTPENDQGIKQ